MNELGIKYHYEFPDVECIEEQDSGKVLALPRSEAEHFSLDRIFGRDVLTPSSIVVATIDMAGFSYFLDNCEESMGAKFVSRFFEWFIDALRKELDRSDTVKAPDPDLVYLWSPLPDRLKSTGDGLTLIWDDNRYTNGDGTTRTEQSRDANYGNLIRHISNVCAKYGEFTTSYLEDFRDARPPRRLRCAMARGMGHPIFDGREYVANCLSLTSRLQKVPSDLDKKITFLAAMSGVEVKHCFGAETRNLFQDVLISRVRGFEQSDYCVAVRSSEYVSLPKKWKNRKCWNWS